MKILECEEKWLSHIDSAVESASDDELFAGGYLRGHISLSVADCEMEGLDDISELKQRIVASLDAAKSELSPADRVIVDDLWQQLQAL
jgi:hypothetical protein